MIWKLQVPPQFGIHIYAIAESIERWFHRFFLAIIYVQDKYLCQHIIPSRQLQLPWICGTTDPA